MDRKERKNFYRKFFLKKKLDVKEEQTEVAQHKKKQKALYAKLTRDKTTAIREETTRRNKKAGQEKAAKRDKKAEQQKEASLEEVRDKANTLKYNTTLARAKPGSVELLLHNRARGMSEARLMGVWGRELVSAAKTLRPLKKEKSL